MAEVARIHDDLDIFICLCNALQNAHRSIRRCVVDEDMLVAVLRKAVHDLAHAQIHGFNVAFLVVAVGQNADGLQNDPFKLCRNG